MKRIILISAFLLISTISHAQLRKEKDAEYYPRNEAYVQYGLPSIFELTTVMIPTSLENDVELRANNIVFSGVVGLGYNFNLRKDATIGLYVGSSLYDADFFSADDPKEVTIYSSRVVNYSTMLSGHWTYYQQGNLQVSAGVYLGLNFRDISISEVSDKPKDIAALRPVDLSYHLTAIKVRYGNIVGGFAELGFGYRGLLNIGLSIKI